VADLSLLLWDVGGVLLSNAWDHGDRKAAVERFDLDGPEFERRHEGVVGRFETGDLDLDGYLRETVFYVPRSFTPTVFREFMFGRSAPIESALATAAALHQKGHFLMAALNNESRELNDFRIQRFRLQEVFDLFLSSCLTRRRKPDPEAYEFALDITRRKPVQALLLDDRPDNIEAAARLGLQTLLVRDPGALGRELKGFGVSED
jgi:putative hydrolase of the HAD superfamily